MYKNVEVENTAMGDKIKTISRVRRNQLVPKRRIHGQQGVGATLFRRIAFVESVFHHPLRALLGEPDVRILGIPLANFRLGQRWETERPVADGVQRAHGPIRDERFFVRRRDACDHFRRRRFGERTAQYLLSPHTSSGRGTRRNTHCRKRKLYNWAYKNGGKNAADVLFYGMPSLAGVTISGSLGMELPILQDLKGDKPWGRQILSSGMEIFGVPVAMLEKIGNTFEFAGKGDYWRATEEALPTAASNVMKAIRLADEGITTRSGKPIADGTGRPAKLSKPEAVAKALGFQPVSQSKAFDAHKGQSDVEAFKKNKQDELVTRYLKAFRAKDTAAKEEVLRDWKDYNNKMIREDKRHLVIKPLYPLAMQRMKPNKPQASMRGYARETMQLQ